MTGLMSVEMAYLGPLQQNLGEHKALSTFEYVGFHITSMSLSRPFSNMHTHFHC